MQMDFPIVGDVWRTDREEAEGPSTTRVDTAVAVATKACVSTSNPSSAAARIPPWLPTRPHSSPDKAPPINAATRPRKRIRCASPVRLLFHAEDGIRDLTVTGVQTCALPIFFPAHPLSIIRHLREAPATAATVACPAPIRSAWVPDTA